MKIISKTAVRVPVKSKEPLPKGRIMDAMEVINKAEVLAPIHIGDVVIANILGLGIDIVATKDIEE